MEKREPGGFKFVLGETKTVYKEKRKVSEGDKISVCMHTSVCKGERGWNKMPFLSAWHTFSGAGSYIMSQRQGCRMYLLSDPNSHSMKNLLTTRLTAGRRPQSDH